MVKLQIWLDDKRDMPDGFDVWAKYPADVIGMIKRGNVVSVSLDNDLGLEDQPKPNEGRHVLDWVESELGEGRMVAPFTIMIHTDNGVARKRMEVVRDRIYRAWARLGKRSSSGP